MRDIAKLNENDKKALFHNTAAKMGMTDAIIEKDFWVCYMLDYLFHRCAWKNNIAFKGGTSLSKSYGSVAGFIPIPFQAYYSAAKAALSAYTAALASEVAPFGITAVCVQPGDIKTGFTAARQKPF